MGTWNKRLYSNDTTCDVRDTYIDFLKQQFSNEKAYCIKNSNTVKGDIFILKF